MVKAISTSRVILGGAEVDLMSFDAAVDMVSDRAAVPGPLPMAVVSVNLDHIKHFGAGGTLNLGTGDRGTRASAVPADQPAVQWLSLLDGAPLVAQAKRMTGQNWPRLAGSDLIEPLLDRAATRGLRVGFLGGTEETHELLKGKLAAIRPDLVVAGWWAPARSELSDPQACRRFAEEISHAGVDILVVGLGKPRQEVWISQYGALTGARVLLAFGAAVDFLAGRVARAPQWVSGHGLEWVWRLVHEPRRLARRYLADGPPAYGRLRLNSSIPAP
ncbi:WecB/TagA/CpsF family glycosyltransferase [Arthrobacter sp. A5]|uniref:WecB/TagA/CpsF family glycosyltransferase n=1 Tax=Arthrobacter sp. A5 TaxID=576926 RepID=UPI003DA935F3